MTRAPKFVVQCDDYTTLPMGRAAAVNLRRQMNAPGTSCPHEHVVLPADQARRPGTNFRED